MKEATGELNASIIVFIAVSLLAAFFFSILWPKIKGDLKTTSKCSTAICKNSFDNKTGRSECHARGSSETFLCPFRG